MLSMFAERRDKLVQSWYEEVSISLYHTLLMCEMVDPSTSSSALVACASAMQTKNDRENRRIGYEGQIEGSYLGENSNVKRTF